MSAFGTNPIPNRNNGNGTSGPGSNGANGASHGSTHGSNMSKDRRRDKRKPFKNNPKKNNPKANGPTATQKPKYSTNHGTNHSTNNEEMVEDMLPAPKIVPKSTTKVQQFTPQEITITGPLIQNPEQLGFRRKPTSKREVPKYLQVQARAINPIQFKQHDWDKANQHKMLQMEQANNGSDYQGIYEEFQRMRNIERKKMEELGLVDAENIRKDLNDAISFNGTCLDMCPIFERVRRALENNVKVLEKDPATNKISRDRAIKAFSRPAAGQPPPLPSEVRPPFVLVKTLDHIIENLVPQLPEAHSFIWDRTRSIRQDFTYQNYYGPESIDCHERIVRIHLVSLHIMAGSDIEHSQQQELEQFNKALQTLMEIYQDVRNRGGKCPNEPEFRAYYLLSHLREPELERELQKLPDYIMKDKLVVLALRFRTLASQNNLVERGYKNSIGGLNLFVEFFRLIFNDDTPFLLACLLETQFNELRFYSIKSMTRGYHTKGKPYDGEVLTALLGFDNTSQLIKFLNYYEIDVIYERTLSTNKSVLVDLVNKEKLETKYKLNSISEKPRLAQFYCLKLDSKITKSLGQFINSGRSNENLNLKSANDMKILESNKNIFKNQVTLNNDVTEKDEEDVKAGSFADFLSRPSTGAGFGSGAKTTGFGSAATGTGFGATGTGFGSEPKSTGFGTSRPEPAPTFNFTQAQPDKQTIKPNPVNEAKPEVKPIKPIETEKPAFNFNSSKATPTFNFGKSDPKPEPPKSFNFGSEQPPKIQLQTQPTQLQTQTPKQLPQVQAPQVQAPSQPKAPAKLKDSKHFTPAARAIADTVIAEVIQQELLNYLPKVVQYENRIQDRKKIIDSLSKELYNAFLNEIIYKHTQELRADHFYQTHLKRVLVRKVSKAGAKLMSKHEFKRKRQLELDDIKFMKSGSLKRQLSNTSFNSSNMSSKRRNWHNEISIDEIVDRRSEIEKLWQPINFGKIMDTCNANLKTRIDKTVNMTGLVLVEDWKLNYSKWLNNKLSLKVNREKSIYEREVLSSDKKLALTFKSLPTKDYLNKQFFHNTSIIVFECGLLSESKTYDIDSKLTRDGLILAKILQLIHKYGIYKLQILIVYWDITRAGLTEEDIKQKLNLENSKYNEVIGHKIICDMSQNNINEILNEGFDKLSHLFTGDLTKRGIKLQRERDSVPTPKTFAKPVSISNDKFKAQEQKLINKAKMDKRYSYLNNHSIHNSMNQLINNLINQQLNKLLFNQLFNQHKLMLNQTINQSMNNSMNNSMNQTLNNSNILDSNVSVLGKFGNEIIEESTPFNSPGKVKLAPTGKPVPNNLQQLIDLTSKIKSKYRSA